MGKKKDKHSDKHDHAKKEKAKEPPHKPESAPPPPPAAKEEAAPAPPEVPKTSPPAVTEREGVLRPTKGGHDPVLYIKQPGVPVKADFQKGPVPTSCTAEGGKHVWKFGVCTHGCGTGRCGVCGEWGRKFCHKVGPAGEHEAKATWELLPNYGGTQHPRKPVAPWAHTGKANMSLPW